MTDTPPIPTEYPVQHPGSHHLKLRWRTGRKIGRTIYVQLTDKPSDADPVIGMMDSRELADEVVYAHNFGLRVAGY